MPIPLFLIAAGISAFGSIASGASARQAGKAAKQEADFLAELMGDQQERDDRDTAQAQQARRSEMQTSMAATGLDISGGSALEIILEQSRLDAISRSAKNFQVEMDRRGVTTAGKNAKKEGDNALLQGVLSGIGAGFTAGAFGKGGTTSNVQQTLAFGDTGTSSSGGGSFNIRPNASGMQGRRLGIL